MSDLTTLLQEQIFATDGFVSATFTGRPKTSLDHPWEKVVIKPVMLKNTLHHQFNYFDTIKSTTKNHAGADATAALNTIIGCGFKNIYIKHETNAVQIQVKPNGKIFVHNHADTSAKADRTHNKTKQRFITADGDNAYLDLLGFTDADGKIKPTMQAKYKQINEFIKLIDSTQDWAAWDKPVSMIDCGAGNAYLTFAAFHYFQDVLKKDTTMTGIDINPELVNNSNARADALKWDKLKFEISNISGHTPPSPPTITLALHACDTATDECLMKAVQWQSDFIFSVPCCHHHLQTQLKQNTQAPGTFKTVTKHGILRERMCDILTDSLRAALLEIMGYKTDVIQFVTTEHTARNLMIRARKTSDKPLPDSIAQYKALKAFWNVTPFLETLLSAGSDLTDRLK